MKKLIAVIAVSILSAACAEEPPTTDVEAAAEQASPAAAAATDAAVTTLARGGDFRFALSESQVLASVKTKCAASPDAQACMSEVEEAAAGEGIQVEPLGDGRIRYRSYSHEGGERRDLIDAELTLASEGDGLVALKIDRVLKGQAPPADAKLLIEVVDANTIAMDKQPGAHPRTGGMRLVFHRQAD